MISTQLYKIQKIITQLEELQTEIGELHDEIQDNYDNLSDYAQESDYGQELEEVMDSLDTASFDVLSTAIDELRNAEMLLDTLSTSEPEEDIEEDIDIDISISLGTGLAYWNRQRNNKEEQIHQQETPYNPYDNHWGNSFDWIDEDEDGYDDREDGFLE